MLQVLLSQVIFIVWLLFFPPTVNSLQAQTQPSLFQCQPSSEQNGQVFSPNIPDFYFSDVNAAEFVIGSSSNLTAASSGVTYIFTTPPPLPNCTGTLVAVEFCYQVFNNANDETDIFNLLFLTRNGFDFTVDSQFTVRSTPESSRCTNPNGPIRNICCDRADLPSPVSFSSSYSFGVVVVNNMVQPLTFASTVTQFNFEHFQVALGVPGPPVGNAFSLGSSSLVNRPLLLMRFFTGKF